MSEFIRVEPTEANINIELTNKYKATFAQYLHKLHEQSSNTQAILVFGSAISSPKPHDIDFLVVSDDPQLNPDELANEWNEKNTDLPRLDFNGFVGTSLTTESMQDYKHDPAWHVAKKQFDKWRKGQEAIVILTYPNSATTYKEHFPKSKIEVIQ